VGVVSEESEYDEMLLGLVAFLDERSSDRGLPLRAGAMRDSSGHWHVVGMRHCCAECSGHYWCTYCGEKSTTEIDLRLLNDDAVHIPMFMLVCAECARSLRSGQVVRAALSAGKN
jgi:hypothetical protein